MNKRFLLTLLLLTTKFVLSQDDLVIISNSQYLIMYRDVDNPFKIAFAGMNTAPYKIKGYGCELSNTDTAGNLLPSHNFILTSTDTEYASGMIKVIQYRDSITSDTVASIEFMWRNLPAPSLFFGGSEPNYYFNSKETMLFPKYGSDVFLDYTFTVLSWEVSVGKKLFKGTGNQLSKEYLNAVKKIKPDSQISIRTKVIGEDGRTHEIEANYIKSPEFVNEDPAFNNGD